MWLTLLLTLLLIGITIRQAMQGFFSALILAVLSICCAAAALGNYEWVAATWVAPMLWPNYALPIALAGLFGIPLMISYAVFFMLFKRACVLPVLMDRVGGGICGFTSAMITVGIAAISLQMIPFDDGKILGFVRMPVVRADNDDIGSPDEPAEGASLLLGPDAFAVSLVSVLSHGVFSTDDSFSEIHPDMMETIGWVGATPEQVSRFAPPGSISIVGSEPLQFVYEMIPGDVRAKGPPTYEPQPPTPGTEFREITVKLGDAARDEQRSHHFTLRQFRLVGRERDRETFDQYHPIAIQQSDASDSTNRHIRYNRRAKPVPVYDEVYRPRDGKKNTVEIVFELPEGFRPSFLEYKREARAAVSFAQKTDSDPQTRAAPTVPPARTASAESSGAAPPSSRRGRRRRAARTSGSDKRRARRGSNVRGVATVEGRSRFSDELPVKLTAYRRLQNTDIQRGALTSGHLVAEVDQQEAGSDPPVGKFFVPDDKRLLQLSTQKLQARSGLGRALSFAVGTLQNYTVMDAKGNQYVVVGKYATARVNGVDVFEVVYFSGPTGRTGGLGKFDRINEKRDLKPTDDFVLLFLVDPGAEIVSFSSGGAASRRDDLVGDKLIAPQ